MKNKQHIFFFFALFSLCKLSAQTNNIDFELTPTGTYTTANAVSGWTISSQTNSSFPTSTVWAAGSPEFSIVSTPIPAFPAIGNILHSPLGGTQVARLNNSTANRSFTKLTRDYFVTSSNTLFQFAYAGVWEEGNHLVNATSSFLFRIKDQSGTILSCTSFSMIPHGSSAGTTYTISPSALTSSWDFWTNWQVQDIDLSSYVNTTITIEVISGDCLFGDHFSTLFFDAKITNYSSGVNFCAGSNQATIVGPPRHYYYQWVAPVTGLIPPPFGNLPTLTINNPIAGSVYSLQLYGGCYPVVKTYTLAYTTASIASISSHSTCLGGTSGSSTVMATGSGSGYTYTWTNSSNSVVSTNSVLGNVPPGTYTVTVAGFGAPGCGIASSSVAITSGIAGVTSLIQPHCGYPSILSYPGGSNYQWYYNSTAITPSLGGIASSYTIISVAGQPTYAVSYDAPNGCRDSIAHILTSTPLGSLSISLNKIICANSNTNSAVLSLTPTPSAAYAGKSFTVFSVGTTPNYSIALNSPFSTSVIASGLISGVAYSVNASDGSCNYSSTFTLTPFDYTLNPSPSPTLCQTQTSNNVVVTDVNLPFSFSNSQFTYSWAPSPFILNGSSNSAHAYLTPSATPGTVSTIIYTVIVTPTLINCPLTKTLALTAVNPLSPTISTIPQLCSDASPYLITVNPTGGNFTNTNGTAIGNISGILNPSLSNIGVNTFFYSNSIGTCVAYSSGSYTVNQLPNISISGNTLICKGQSITLLANGASTYTWSNSSLSPFITVNPFITNSYSVIGSDALTGCSNSKNILVTVEPYPILSIQGSTLLCPGETTTLNANGASTYSWSNGFSLQTIVVSPTITSTYTLVGTSGLASCSSTQAITIQVELCNLTNIFQRNSKETLMVYPNPTSGKFFIEAENIRSIVVTDELGKIILEEHFEKENYQLDLSGYSNGMYFLKLFQNNEIKTLKLIKAD